LREGIAEQEEKKQAKREKHGTYIELRRKKNL